MSESTTDQSPTPTSTLPANDRSPPSDTSAADPNSVHLATKDLPHTLDENRDAPPLVARRKDARIFKIIVIGDSNCGKTCLTYRFCEGRFPNQVEATIGVDFREKFVDLEGENLKLQLWDTAGQERFRRSMVPHYYRNVHAVVYVYDVTKRSTFDGLAIWLHEFQQFAPVGLDVPRIVIGNKVDLDGLREVSVSEGQNFADGFSMPHFETSAKDDTKTDHTDAIFMTLAHKLKASKPMMGERYSRSSDYDPLSSRSIKYTAIGQDKKSTCC